MDEEGIDISILYPSIGLTLPRIEDTELSAAHCRAYNNWIRDFCSQRSRADCFLPSHCPGGTCN